MMWVIRIQDADFIANDLALNFGGFSKWHTHSRAPRRRIFLKSTHLLARKIVQSDKDQTSMAPRSQTRSLLEPYSNTSMYKSFKLYIVLGLYYYLFCQITTVSLTVGPSPQRPTPCSIESLRIVGILPLPHQAIDRSRNPHIVHCTRRHDEVVPFVRRT